MSSRSAKNGLAEFWLDGWHGESMENDGSLGWPLEARVGAIRTTAPVDGGSKRGRRQPAAQGAGERAAKIRGEGLSVVLLPASTVPIWRDGLGRFGDHTASRGG